MLIWTRVTIFIRFFLNYAAEEKLEIVSGAAPPPFRVFAGGFPRRLRRRNAFGLIQEYCATLQKKVAMEAVFQAK